jgi:hypothetical protein
MEYWNDGLMEKWGNGEVGSERLNSHPEIEKLRKWTGKGGLIALLIGRR